MVTIDELQEAIRKQSRDAANLIARMKDEGDLQYLGTINALELVIKANEFIIEKVAWHEATQEELQSYYNVLLSHQNYFQGSN